MKLKNVRLSLANVARTTNSKTMPVNETGTVKKRLEDGTFSDAIVNYTVECSARHGDTLKVKFPLSVAEKIEELNKLLRDDVTIEIAFTNLKLTPYALAGNNGSVISGVSASADDFTIVTTNADDIVIDLD